MGVFPAYCLCATCMLGAHRGVSEAVNFPSGRAAISPALLLYNTEFHFPFLGRPPPPPGPLLYLTSVGILNETHTSKDTKLKGMCARKYVM